MALSKEMTIYWKILFLRSKFWWSTPNVKNSVLLGFLTNCVWTFYNAMLEILQRDSSERITKSQNGLDWMGPLISFSFNRCGFLTLFNMDMDRGVFIHMDVQRGRWGTVLHGSSPADGKGEYNERKPVNKETGNNNISLRAREQQWPVLVKARAVFQ